MVLPFINKSTALAGWRVRKFVLHLHLSPTNRSCKLEPGRPAWHKKTLPLYYLSAPLTVMKSVSVHVCLLCVCSVHVFVCGCRGSPPGRDRWINIESTLNQPIDVDSLLSQCNLPAGSCGVVQVDITFNVISVISWWCLLVAHIVLHHLSHSLGRHCGNPPG